MSPRSVREYVTALRPRYRSAARSTRSQMLDEAERITGYHRKTLIGLLRPARERAPRRRGRAPRYGPEVAAALKTLWEASDRACSKRLVPFLPTLLDALERHGRIAATPEVREALLEISPATADRLLAPHRKRHSQHPYAQRRAPSALQAMVPIRTFGDWNGLEPGEVQADLVLHCGDSTAGFFLATLVAVDVVSTWTELQPVWGTGDRRVKTGVHHVRTRMPFPMRAFHADNGGEFLNHALYRYCREEGIDFSRGRSNKKNDQAWVEQRNWTAVRRLVGYERYATQEAYELLTQLYPQLSRYLNFFHPVRKIIGKSRQGARVTKHYDEARTPYQRLLDAGVLDDTTLESLEDEFLALDPVALKQDVERILEQLWSTSERPTAR